MKADPDWWKTMFDEVYLVTDARSVGDAELTSREVDLLQELLGLAPGDRLLDLCGGQGRHSLELWRRGIGGATVLDFSPCLVGRGRVEAERAGADVRFVEGDARATGLPADWFDCVIIMGNSLGYQEGRDGDLKILKEAWRVLRPGGRFLADVADGKTVKREFRPTAWHESGDIVVCRKRELRGRALRSREMVLSKKGGLVRDLHYAIRLYEARELEELAASAGFVEASVTRGFSDREDGEDYGFMNRRMLVTARKPPCGR